MKSSSTDEEWLVQSSNILSTMINKYIYIRIYTWHIIKMNLAWGGWVSILHFVQPCTYKMTGKLESQILQNLDIDVIPSAPKGPVSRAPNIQRATGLRPQQIIRCLQRAENGLKQWGGLQRHSVVCGQCSQQIPVVNPHVTSSQHFDELDCSYMIWCWMSQILRCILFWRGMLGIWYVSMGSSNLKQPAMVFLESLPLKADKRTPSITGYDAMIILTTWQIYKPLKQITMPTSWHTSRMISININH